MPATTDHRSDVHRLMDDIYAISKEATEISCEEDYRFRAYTVFADSVNCSIAYGDTPEQALVALRRQKPTHCPSCGKLLD